MEMVDGCVHALWLARPGLERLSIQLYRSRCTSKSLELVDRLLRKLMSYLDCGLEVRPM